MAKSIPRISGMDWIVEQFSQDKLKPDEFTAQMVKERTGQTDSAVRCRLMRMYDMGELTKRKVILNGVIVNAYRRAEEQD